VNTPLSHNFLAEVTSRPAENEAVAFSQLRTSLIKVLRNSPESREPICDLADIAIGTRLGNPPDTVETPAL